MYLYLTIEMLRYLKEPHCLRNTYLKFGVIKKYHYVKMYYKNQYFRITQKQNMNFTYLLRHYKLFRACALLRCLCKTLCKSICINGCTDFKVGIIESLCFLHWTVLGIILLNLKSLGEFNYAAPDFGSKEWKLYHTQNCNCVGGFNKKKYYFLKNTASVTGLEPAIPRSEVWCLIH